MRSTSLLFVFISACSDYDLVAQSTPQGVDEDAGIMDEPTTETAGDESCQHDRSAYIQAEVVSLGQDAWTPGWNTIAKFTLTTDKDTCYDETFAFDFTTTDNADTDWNDCEEYEGQDRLRIFRVIGTDSDGDVLQELNASWTFQGATGDQGSYVHYCETGRFIVDAKPQFVEEDTALLAGDPLTFVVMMEAEGSTDPEDKMQIGLLWDDSSQVWTNSANHHGREGDMLSFE